MWVICCSFLLMSNQNNTFTLRKFSKKNSKWRFSDTHVNIWIKRWGGCKPVCMFCNMIFSTSYSLTLTYIFEILICLLSQLFLQLSCYDCTFIQSEKGTFTNVTKKGFEMLAHCMEQMCLHEWPLIIPQGEGFYRDGWQKPSLFDHSYGSLYMRVTIIYE